jgi:hypothetical protein
MLIFYEAFNFSDKPIAKGSLRLDVYDELVINTHLLNKIGDSYSHFKLTKPIEHDVKQPDKTVDTLKNIFGMFN